MNKYLAEFLAAAFFIYVILLTGNAFAIGAALAIAIFVSAGISGGHVNPAVSVVMTLAGKLPVSDLLPYVVAQVAGGVLALAAFRFIKL